MAYTPSGPAETFLHAPGWGAVSFLDSIRKLVPNANFWDDFWAHFWTRATLKCPNYGTNIFIFQKSKSLHPIY